MNPFALMRRLSTRVHLALGLAGLAVGVMLAATYLKLIPDAEAMTRQHRGALAETIALTASALIDEEQPEALQETLEFLRGRNPGLLSVGVRSNDGQLLLDVAAVGLPPVPPMADVAPPTTDTQQREPLTDTIDQAPTGVTDDGATVAVGLPPVPPPATGVTDDGATVAVGLPPVPATPGKA